MGLFIPCQSSHIDDETALNDVIKFFDVMGQTKRELE